MGLPARNASILWLAGFLFVVPAGGSLTHGSDEPKLTYAKPLRRDSLGDPLPFAAQYRLGTTRLRYDGYINTMALSPDGTMVAAGNVYRSVRVWEVRTGKDICELNRGGSIVFAPDGKSLSSVDTKGNICLWDIPSGKMIAYWPGNDDFSPSLSPDGKISISASRTALEVIRLRDVATGRIVRTLKLSHGRATSAALSADGKTLAAADAQKTEIRIVDVESQKVLKVVKAVASRHSDVQSYAFAPAQNVLAYVGLDKVVHLWDVSAGRELRSWKYPHGAGGVVFSGDGKTLAITSWPITHIVDVTGGREIVSWKSEVSALTRSGKLAVSGEGQLVRVWDTNTGKEFQPVAGNPPGVLRIEYSRNGKAIATWADYKIRHWDAATGRELSECLTPGLLLFGCSTGSKIWAAVESKPATSGVIVFLDKDTGTTIHRLNLNCDVLEVSFSPDDKMIAVTLLGDWIYLFSVDTWKEVGRFHLEKEITAKPVFSPNGKNIATVDQDRAIQVWDVPSGRQIQRFLGDEKEVTSMVFCPDNKTLITGARDHTLRQWEVTTGKQMRIYQKDHHGARLAACSPDGKIVASAGDGTSGVRGRTVLLWEVATGREILELVGHQGAITSVAFSPDGKTLSTASEDTTCLVWDLSEASRGDSRPPATMDVKDLDRMWSDLRDPAPCTAYTAIWKMVEAQTQTLAFFEDHLRPVAAPGADRIAQLVHDLGDESFSVRSKAAKDLQALGELAEPELRRALSGRSSIEVRRRLEELLRELEGPVTNSEKLRLLRSIQVLEQIGTPRAVTLLQKLATGAACAHVTDEAKESLERLKKRLARQR
jgi:WD40 repeat protein